MENNVLKRFYQRLSNLSTKNKSLVLLQLSKRLFIDLHSFHFSDKKSSFSLLTNLLTGTTKTGLTSVLDARDGRANVHSEQLRTLLKTHQTILEERGTHDLHLGFPFVTGQFVDGTIVRAPFLLVPVQLWAENNHWYIARKPHASIRLNRDFMLAYGYRNQVQLPESLLDASFDDFPTDIIPFLTQLYAFIQESVLEINFNRELFEQQLHFFESKTTDDIKQTCELGTLKLFPEAVIGFFPLHSSFLAADYAHLLAQQSPHLLVENHLKAADWQAHNTSVFLEEELFLGFPVDASQEATIREVKTGKSLVVIGPPGSGKSQLISNLITDFTSRGKKVLVVCQKKAALDTVFTRLSHIGLAPFLIQVHDTNAYKSLVFNKLLNQIEQINDYESAIQQLDSIALDKQFRWTSRRIQQIETELTIFKNALFDTSFCGKSIKDLYLTTRNVTVNTLDSTLFSEFRAEDFSIFIEKIQAFVFFRKQLDEATTHTAFFRHLYKNQRNEWTAQTDEELVKQVNSYKNKIELFKELLQTKTNQLSDKIPILLQDWLDILLQADAKVHEHLFWHLKKDKPLLSNDQKKKVRACISASATTPILTNQAGVLHKEALDTIETSLIKARKKISFPLGKQLFRWTNPHDFALLDEWLPQEWDLNDFHELHQRIEVTRSYHSIYQEVTKKTNLFKVTELADFTLLLEAEKIRVQCKKTIQNPDYVAVSEIIETFTSLASLQAWANQLMETKKEVDEVKKANYLLTQEQNDYLETISLAQLQENIPICLPLVAELHRISQEMRQSELMLLELVETTTLPTEWLERLQYSWSTFWINRIEKQVPILQGVTSKKIDFLEEELQELLKKKEAISQDKIRLALREQCCLQLEKNRLNKLVSYRELKHQVSKKRQTWPLRKLIGTFHQDILRLAPCWLTTPEVAACLFPLQDAAPLFDLVIFDEASQCPVEQGLPLVLRGKQTVITGDPQQLPPFDLYQAKIEQNTDDNALLEVSSLLDAASFLLPQVQLNGHYRSQSMELIQFSNKHFYHNKLELIPDYKLFKDKINTLFYRKVAGTWENNQNEIEADEVKKLVQEKWEKDPTQTIGVITFNHSQSQLIERKIESLPHLSSVVRVKNIENVQGDEFDIVIFSIGYAPNTSQKMSLHFGSLNVLGGEKRLNVAITRAKKQLHVITSIWPTELHVEQTKNEGPKLLKAFLTYVLETTTSRQLPTQIPSKHTLAYILQQNNPTIQFSPLPFSDLIQTDEEGNYTLLLTDDNLYYSMKSIKQTHGYFPRLLAQKNWRFVRKWSRH